MDAKEASEHRAFLEKASKQGGAISARSARFYLALLDERDRLAAELAEARPLLEAVMKDFLELDRAASCLVYNDWPDEADILRAARAYRAKREA